MATDRKKIGDYTLIQDTIQEPFNADMMLNCLCPECNKKCLQLKEISTEEKLLDSSDSSWLFICNDCQWTEVI